MISKETALALASNAAASQFTGFLQQYIEGIKQPFVNPQIGNIITEATAGDNILQATNMNTVRKIS